MGVFEKSVGCRFRIEGVCFKGIGSHLVGVLEDRSISCPGQPGRHNPALPGQEKSLGTRG